MAGWHAYDATLRPPPSALPGLSAAQDAAMRSQYWLSANVLKADEDKTYPGAFVASPTDPWGQSVPATTTHPGWTYREVFTRDSYETFTGLLADGDLASARALVEFLYDRAQQANGSFPRDSLLNGAVAPDLFGLVEIDEDAYPLLMAWEAGFAGDVAFYRDHIRPDADFVVDHGPAYGVERWEEHPGFSPSTIAAEIAGLLAAARLAQAAGDPARARLYLATADYYQRNVERWTVTTTGPYAPRYFVRVSPTGNPNTRETYDLGNGSLSNGHPWPLLDGERAEQDLQSGELNAATSLTVTTQQMSSGLGLVPEQAWEDPDVPASPYGSNPKTASIGFTNGKAAGSASPLIWAQAQYLRLVLDLGAGHLLDQPAITRSRYVTSGPPATVPLTIKVTAPGAVPVPPSTSTAAPAVTEDVLASQEPGLISKQARAMVTGTTEPGAVVDVAVSQPGAAASTTTVIQVVAGSNGSFRTVIATPPGQSIVTVSVTAGPHATGWAQQTVTGKSA